MKTFSEKGVLSVLTLLALCLAGLMYSFGLQKNIEYATERNIITNDLALDKIYSISSDKYYEFPFYYKEKIYAVGYPKGKNDGTQSIDELDSFGVYEKSFASNKNAKGQFEIDSIGIYNFESAYGTGSYIYERDFNDSVLYVFQTKQQTLESVRVGKHMYIVKLAPVDVMKYSFVDEYAIVNTEIGIVSKMNVILTDSAFYLQRYGFFVKGNDGINFKVAREAGLFFAFTDSGKVLYQTETIDKSPSREIVSSPDGFRPSPKRTSIGNFGAAAFHNNLLILTGVLKKESQRIIDIYEQTSGRYKGSFIAPILRNERAHGIANVNNRQVLLLYDTFVGYLTIPESSL